MFKQLRVDVNIDKVEVYMKKGCLATCSYDLSSDSWEELVLETIKFAQIFGTGWALSGSIDEEINLSTTSFHHGNGVTLAHIQISRLNSDSIKS
jgi:hypothetical protein